MVGFTPFSQPSPFLQPPVRRRSGNLEHDNSASVTRSRVTWFLPIRLLQREVDQGRAVAKSRKKETLAIGPDRLATPEAINALPMPLRKYIRDHGTNADPPGMVRENIVLKQQVDALTVRIDAMKRTAREKVVTATRGL